MRVNSKILVLPAFTETQSISSTVYRSIMLHQKIKGLVKYDIIPNPIYQQISIEDMEALYERGLAYPEDAVLQILSEAADSIQAESLSKSLSNYEESIIFLQQEDKNNFYRSESLERSMNQLKERVGNLQQAANVLPVLMVDHEKEFSLDRSHIQTMGNEYWVEDLLLFLKYLTESSIAVDHEKIAFDSFLFYKNGRIAKFIHFDCLDITASEDVFWQNIKALKKLMNNFYEYFYEYIDKYFGINHHNTGFSRLDQYIVQNDHMIFTSFDEILAVFHNKEIPSTTGERIGVFVDKANIYTGLNNMNIDYIKLFSAIYGKENTKYIKDKFIFFFDAVNENIDNPKLVQKDQDLKAVLKEQGFHIDVSRNGQAKAKQIMNGVIRDEDDAKLIQRMEERLPRLTSVLLLSGDKDYLEILRKYRMHGKSVKVISTHPNSTSKSLIDEFDHRYITEYWDCILLKEES